MKKRDKFEIMYDILFTLLNKNGKMRPTQLMYKSNLSYRMMNQYLDELIEKQLINKIELNNRKYIVLTDKGREFLDKLIKMKNFKETFFT